MAHNFTLGSKTNEDLNISMLNSPREALPEVIGKIEENHNRPGGHDYGGDYAGLIIKLECYFTRAGHEENLQEDIRALTDHLTNNEGRPREMDLTFPAEPNKTYSIRYDGSGLQVERGLSSNQGEFTLTLIAVDPRAKAPEDKITQNVSSSPEKIELVNSGNINTPFKMEVTNKGDSQISDITIELM